MFVSDPLPLRKVCLILRTDARLNLDLFHPETKKKWTKKKKRKSAQAAQKSTGTQQDPPSAPQDAVDRIAPVNERRKLEIEMKEQRDSAKDKTQRDEWKEKETRRLKKHFKKLLNATVEKLEAQHKLDLEEAVRNTKMVSISMVIVAFLEKCRCKDCDLEHEAAMAAKEKVFQDTLRENARSFGMAQQSFVEMQTQALQNRIRLLESALQRERVSFSTNGSSFYLTRLVGTEQATFNIA